MDEMTATFANFMPIILMLLIFYFLLYRPQKKAQEERSKMLDSLKVGNRVITIGGIYGTIVSLTDEIVTVKIANNVEVEMARNAINGVADKNVSA
ncbi:MAG: preprotein translocase subunit YajC [Selenomonadaceae bacterium]|nr:preprotein translocase subunit YajC [Selenomonadaceae bacterium]MBQ9497961.1 preprotein translocase subunit YajC [Selenomonadaceae bacterium]